MAGSRGNAVVLICGLFAQPDSSNQGGIELLFLGSVGFDGNGDSAIWTSSDLAEAGHCILGALGELPQQTVAVVDDAVARVEDGDRATKQRWQLLVRGLPVAVCQGGGASYAPEP